MNVQIADMGAIEILELGASIWYLRLHLFQEQVGIDEEIANVFELWEDLATAQPYTFFRNTEPTKTFVVCHVSEDCGVGDLCKDARRPNLHALLLNARN